MKLVLQLGRTVRSRRFIALGLIAGSVLAFLGVAARPEPRALSGESTGDPGLAAEARPLLDGALDRVSIAVVDGSSVTFAGFGADEHTEFEIGSITKVFTGQLLADAIARGEVRGDTRVGELLPLGAAPVSDARLDELATHRSGLSAQGMQLMDSIAFTWRFLRNRDPFTQDAAGVLAIARTAELTNRGEFLYSNLGTALLGHALAAAAGTDYPALLESRVLQPLEMTSTRLPLTPHHLGADATTGFTSSGSPVAAWTIDGWAPAGGARSTAADLVRFAQAVLDGKAPGLDALAPKWDVGAQSVGYGWHVRAGGGTTAVFKNGLTGGFTSKIVLDRERHRAVIVLSSTAAPVDAAADGLLERE